MGGGQRLIAGQSSYGWSAILSCSMKSSTHVPATPSGSGSARSSRICEPPKSSTAAPSTVRSSRPRSTTQCPPGRTPGPTPTAGFAFRPQAMSSSTVHSTWYVPGFAAWSPHQRTAVPPNGVRTWASQGLLGNFATFTSSTSIVRSCSIRDSASRAVGRSGRGRGRIDVSAGKAAARVSPPVRPG
ncbi:hypothetical protein SVEN_7239 [Streptomyces venezuelae ATCC 10712]|uniref:Uncharacterized protein n=1 Tax=Streptomyces venezuelae (strain ATCC 10712 / CBS 650.69 / DSM 40230 / JCM 4526 / NBRC 13096 / PD 04745) TaxID=953739 RepID=F2RLZ5_STRVP|nr:hypothetical protein SVEN_7239 [Streptomyces venezuelae ATCC 10712]